MSKRNRIAKLLDMSRFYKIPGISKNPTNSLVVLAYHRVLNIGDEVAYPFDPELISACENEFAWQVDYVAKNFNVITFDDFLNYQAGIQTLPKNPLIITFDDGYLDNYEKAYPILKSKGVPATFFISTDYMDKEETFWFDDVAFQIFHSNQNKLHLTFIDKDINTKTIEEKRLATEEIIEHLKTIDNDARLSALEEIHDIIGKPAYQNPLSKPMTWDQVKTMAKNGMEFGSHTVTHPILSQISDEQLKEELLLSKQTIESKIEKPCDTISYPVGGESDFDNRTVQLAKQLGYKIGISYKSGLNPLDDIQQFDINRLHIERYTSRATFKMKPYFPNFFY